MLAEKIMLFITVVVVTSLIILLQYLTKELERPNQRRFKRVRKIPRVPRIVVVDDIMKGRK